MSMQLFSVLAAAALTATGLGGAGDTRSADSLPTKALALPAQNLALAQRPAASGKLRGVSRLADASSDSTDQSNCERGGGSWDAKDSRCRRAGGWWSGSGVRLLILAGTAVGIGVAVSESSHNSVSN